MQLAPIGLSTYSRLGHLKQTVEALQKNELAGKSELHVFSDAPKIGDEEKVQAVRDYIKTIDGFKKVHIYERKENNRVANNRGGMRMLLDKYERMIFLEEDVITSPFFLRFMNDALRVYKDDNRVLAITGYGPLIGYPDGYSWDVVMGKRMYCWAFAIWKNRFDLIDMDIKKSDYWKIRLNPYLMHQYMKAGQSVMPQLKHISVGTVEALDIRVDYTLFKHHMFVLYPRYSMLQNIGLDGSGEHWTVSTDKFDVSLAKKSLTVVPGIPVNNDVLHSMAVVHAFSINQKIAWILADLGLYGFALKLRNWYRQL